MNVPTAIAAAVARANGDHAPACHQARIFPRTFDIPVLRATGELTPDGLYDAGPRPCEFVLYCDGSVACFPCGAEGTTSPAALESPEHWGFALAALDIAAPRSREEMEDFIEGLAVMLEETEAAYGEETRALFSEAARASALR